MGFLKMSREAAWPIPSVAQHHNSVKEKTIRLSAGLGCEVVGASPGPGCPPAVARESPGLRLLSLTSGQAQARARAGPTGAQAAANPHGHRGRRAWESHAKTAGRP
jgi:hypothetical protein